MDILVYVFFYIISLAVAFRLGWTARELHAKKILSELAKMAEEHAKETDKSIRIKIEKSDHGFFVYSMEDDTFMAQGSTRSELEENLVARYPGKTFAAKHENLIEVGFLPNESV